MKKIPRKILLDIVARWEAGILSEIQVHEKAEELWEQNDWLHYDKDNSNSIAIEVLSKLELLNHNLVTIEDIPAVIDFLMTPKGQEKDGWKNWRQYWESIDLEDRKRALKDNQYYCT